LWPQTDSGQWAIPDWPLYINRIFQKRKNIIDNQLSEALNKELLKITMCFKEAKQQWPIMHQR
jgi:hypothetical protein